MLGDIALLLVGAVLLNNFVLVQFLGLCPFMGVSNKLETAMGMSMATTFVLTLASVCSYLTYNYLCVKSLEAIKSLFRSIIIWLLIFIINDIYLLFL